MAHLTAEQLERLQKLAHLHLTDEERNEFLGQLDSIIGFLQQLNDIDTTDVEPLTHPSHGHVTPIVDQEAHNDDSDLILANVKHRLINKAIKIKSQLGW